MNERTTKRRLTALMMADIAGYSRLVGQDERGTVERVRQLRAEVLEPAIAEKSGRLVKSLGDGFLAEFASAVDATACAVKIQEGAAQQNSNRSNGEPLLLRIGVHVGDVLVEGDDLLGDGVNVVARVEAAAEPGSVCLSADAFRHVEGKLPFAFEDLGERALKNIARPVRLYRWASAAAKQMPHAALALPDKPSIAVLPFQNLSGAPEQDYFADGIVEDIITALSRFRSLFVIARNSTFTYKQRAIDIRIVGQELGVRYVLEGSVRLSGLRLRLSGQLIDARDGTHLWAERFEGQLEDVFALQDDMTARVVGAIAPRVEAAEIERSKRARPESLDAYDLYLRALASVREMTLEDSDHALSLVDRALKIDPQYAVAAGLGAWAHTLRVAQNWPLDRAAETRRGVQYARIAVAKGQSDAEALAAGGYALAFLGGELHEGLRAIERAISLNPNSAMAFSHAGFVRNYLGQPAEAIEALERTIRLSPRDPTLFRAQAAFACAYLFLGQFDEAIDWGRRAVESNPQYTPSYRQLAAALAHAGHLDEARNVIARLRALVPDISVATLPEPTIFKHSGRLELILDGLRKAGLPEQ